MDLTRKQSPVTLMSVKLSISLFLTWRCHVEDALYQQGPDRNHLWFRSGSNFQNLPSMQIKKAVFLECRDGEGDAMTPFALNAGYLDVLRYPKIKLARAIKTKKYATDHHMICFCLHFCTLQVQQLHCCACECFQKSYVSNITHWPSENRQMFLFLHTMGACGHCGDFSPDPNFGTL